MTTNLTGQKRYRSNWRGKIILQVQEHYDFTTSDWTPGSPSIDTFRNTGYRWRDATTEDLTQLASMKGLSL